MKASVNKLEIEKQLTNLKKIIPEENIKINEPMSKHTSFKTGGPAEIYIIGKTLEQIQAVLKYSNRRKRR